MVVNLIIDNTFEITSVVLKPKIPKEPHILYFGTKKFEQFRFQSIRAPITKL